MLINENSLIIDGVNMAQYLTKVKFGYHKLWSSDTGRNMAGTNSGTLVGIFPKIILQFRKLTKSELEVITPILDSANQTLTYYDPTKQASTTMTTYTGDYEITNKNIISNGVKNEGFQVSFIAVRKRS